MKYYYKINTFDGYYKTKRSLKHLYDNCNKWSPGGSAETITPQIEEAYNKMCLEFENEHPEIFTVWGLIKLWINT